MSPIPTFPAVVILIPLLSVPFADSCNWSPAPPLTIPTSPDVFIVTSPVSPLFLNLAISAPADVSTICNLAFVFNNLSLR